MKTVATNDAKTHLSALLQEVKQGSVITILRGREPVARLVPCESPPRARPKVGEVLDEPMHVPEEALTPLSRDDLHSWGLT